MATYAKAFIDNGQIKIVNRDGVDFEQAIQERASSLFKIKFLFRFFIALMIGFGLTSFSPLFFNFISGWQIAFFVALTIGSLVMAGNYSDTITAKKKTQREMVAEYNLAKEELQVKVMELQKKLAQHNSDMQQIETQAKFSFKKSQEMTV